MNIHNQMQDLVVSLVTEIFDAERLTEKRSFCVCSQCRLDVSCYVLNRVQPRYVISERGVAHTESLYSQQVQENADIVTLIHEGIERVSSSKRPFFSHTTDDSFRPEQGAVYNFPMVKGRIFNGNNFEPISQVDVALKADSEMVAMADPNWQNPCHIYESSSGAFFFLPSPTSAAKPGDQKSFQFEVIVEDDRFDALHHFFSMTSVADARSRYALHTNESYSTADLYIFPKD
jgi:competence protein ComFB